MTEATRICPSCCSTPQIAVDSYQVTQRLNDQTQYAFVSTFNAEAPPRKQYKFKSESERLAARMGQLSLGQCQ